MVTKILFYSMDTKRMKTQGGPKIMLYSMDSNKKRTQGCLTKLWHKMVQDIYPKMLFNIRKYPDSVKTIKWLLCHGLLFLN